MSLLLDALKKAAEQKAEKSKQEVPQGGSSDETIVDAAAEDVSALEGDVDSGLRQPQRNLQDETELDNSDFNTRLERTRVERDDGTETRLEPPDPTITETPSLSSQMQTGEDETIIFAEEDVADFMGEPEFVQRETRPADDETDLSQLAQRDDETDVSELAQPEAVDETDLSQLAQREDETDVSQLAQREAVDETDLSQLAAREDETDISQLTPRESAEETDLSQLAAREDDTDISQPLPLAEANEPPAEAAIDEDATEAAYEAGDGDETDISVPPASVADLEHAVAQRQASEGADDISEFIERAEDDTDTTGGEDMSLLLVERDQTNLTSPTSTTDPQLQQGQALQAEGDDDDGLALVDTTRHRAPAGVAPASEGTSTTVEAQTSSTATTGIAYDTQTGVTSRTEPTSTRTYAPDNYDRTLMRLPSDDASKLFAGMKSDSDVVMTPEYAKKVFHSKSSAQRIQHYKIYGGIAAIILGAIIIYGLSEYQQQSDNIDNSLRALKRDPMPGIIRPQSEDSTGSLFAEAEVDERTIDLIESADNPVDPAIPDSDDIVEEAESDVAIAETAAQGETGVIAEMATVDETEVATLSTEAADPVETSSQSLVVSTSTGDGASTAAPETAQSEKKSSSSSLQIVSSQTVEQKSIWLREAYAAYQAGNDEQAMRLYNKVLEADPGNRNALLARAAIHVQKNNSVDAIRDYQTLLLANPKDSLAMASLIAIANYSPQDTESQLKLMMRDEPDSPYLNFALANAYGAQNRWQEAQTHYFRALENNPNDPNYAYNLAVSLEHISQPRAAISYYRRALNNLDNGLATFSKEVVDQRLELLGKL